MRAILMPHVSFHVNINGTKERDGTVALVYVLSSSFSSILCILLIIPHYARKRRNLKVRRPNLKVRSHPTSSINVGIRMQSWRGGGDWNQWHLAPDKFCDRWVDTLALTQRNNAAPPLHKTRAACTYIGISSSSSRGQRFAVFSAGRQT